jgi:hypothetical protein
MLVQTDVRIDPVLSNVSVAYKNEDYIAEQILPVQSVAVTKGKYYVYDQAMFRRNKTLRAPGAKANEVEYGLTTASFELFDYALKEKIEWGVIDQADVALSPETDAVESVTEMLLVDAEMQLATTLSTTSIITQYTTLSGTSQWSDYTNSDPLGDIKTARQTVQASIMRKPNTLILGQQVYDTLVDHPDVVERVKYSFGVSPTPELMARIFQVEKVIVGSALYNSATEGQTDSMAYIWGKKAWVCYISPNTKGLKQITLGWTMKKKTGRTVKKWDDVDEEARYVRVNEERAQTLVAALACYYIAAVIA